MADVLQDSYRYLVAFHLIFAFAWMAGLFYLPRLYVYHAEVGPGTPQSETFKVMERRLLKAIMNPALIATWLIGLVMAFGAGGVNMATDGWFHAKLTLLLAMSAFHGFLGKWRKDFEADRNTRSPKFYRIVNEIPTVLLIGIVILAVVRPF